MRPIVDLRLRLPERRHSDPRTQKQRPWKSRLLEPSALLNSASIAIRCAGNMSASIPRGAVPSSDPSRGSVGGRADRSSSRTFSSAVASALIVRQLSSFSGIEDLPPIASSTINVNDECVDFGCRPTKKNSAALDAPHLAHAPRCERRVRTPHRLLLVEARRSRGLRTWPGRPARMRFAIDIRPTPQPQHARVGGPERVGIMVRWRSVANVNR